MKHLWPAADLLEESTQTKPRTNEERVERILELQKQAETDPAAQATLSRISEMLNRELEAELARHPDGGAAIIAEFLSSQTEIPGRSSSISAAH